eukprot:m.237479 g.237479  ORF g.237479 m.237479 type:complete len:56 (+) comp17418_c0_seq30:2649-2816(+)
MGNGDWIGKMGHKLLDTNCLQAGLQLSYSINTGYFEKGLPAYINATERDQAQSIL